MARLNILLIVALVVFALATVAANHRARKLFGQIEHEQARMRELDVEWGQLQLEQSTWAANARVAKIARERLHMNAPGAGQVLSLEPVTGTSGRR